MNWWGQMVRAWGPEMNAADRTRVVLAWGFIFGAVSHVGWVIVHGDFWYHGPGPEWAPWFWYGICLVDFVVCWLLLAHPRSDYRYGVYRQGTTAMHVSPGLGTTFVPFRFFARPAAYELVLHSRR